MAQALADIRKAAAARYNKVPEDQRPRLRLCDDCKKPVYDSKICSASGRYHIVDEKNTLRIGTAVLGDQKVVEGKELMKAFEANRIRWQEARVKLVKIDQSSAEIFQSFAVQRNWQLMRYGILYGTYDASNQSVSVHTIYEPSQHGDSQNFYPQLPDAAEEKADALAKLFGLERVGVIATHGPRDKSVVPLSSTELITVTKEQSRFGDHCVIVTVGPASDQGNTVTADAWQATEQAVNLYRAGLIDVCDQHAQYIQSKEPLEVVLGNDENTNAATGKKQPPKTMEPSHFVDTKWMTGYIGIETFSTPLFSNKFARYDRPGELPLSLQNVGAFMQAPTRTRLSFAEQIQDYHMLFFLAVQNIFDIKADFPVIISALMGKDNANALKGYEEILKGMIKSSGK
eukprot:GILI01017030.1.p1 GENE.GILI01017030.1~~GILI01017030.1.p1  ORF type:complete len:400 (-),score=73.36 GILI01017030.1:123-1322(-)